MRIPGALPKRCVQHHQTPPREAAAQFLEGLTVAFAEAAAVGINDAGERELANMLRWHDSEPDELDVGRLQRMTMIAETIAEFFKHHGDINFAVTITARTDFRDDALAPEEAALGPRPRGDRRVLVCP